MDPVPLMPLIMAAQNTVKTILIIAIFALLLLSAFFSATESAYASVNRIKLKNLENGGNKRAKKVLKQLENYQQLLSTVLIGNNIVNITASTLTAAFFNMIISNPSLATFLATAILTFIVLMFCEIIPKSIAKEKAEKAVLLFQPVVAFFEMLFLPFNWIFGLWRKIYKPKKTESITEDELITIVEEAETGGEIDAGESLLIRSAIEFDDVEVYDIMQPRMDVIAVEENDSIESIADIFFQHEFSRLPVYQRSIDFVVGILHEKDFYKVSRGECALSEVLKPSICLSRNMKISHALKVLQKAKTHMAIVVDEFGGTSGIVTMEDILEELVGEIYDEHDEEEDLFKQTAENIYVISGAFSLTDMLIGLGMDESLTQKYESASVGGWVTEILRRIPKAEETFTYKNLDITVTKADERRVLEIMATVKPIDSDEDNSGD